MIFLIGVILVSVTWFVARCCKVTGHYLPEWLALGLVGVYILGLVLVLGSLAVIVVPFLLSYLP